MLTCCQWHLWLACLASAALLARPSWAQDFRIERIASGLDQPTYVAQAPGDPANILYYTERTSNTVGGFGTVNPMGKVWRYDVAARTKSLVLDLSARNVINDDGLQSIAFHPDFNLTGAPGYRKMYVSSAEQGATAVNRVEEYTLDTGGAATASRVILQYNNDSQNNHTVGWIGFDPTATGAARNYLHIATGDGSFSSAVRPSQNPADLKGKILRVDVAGADAYGTDANKNFAIPPSNPIPAYNAAHPTSTLAGLGEVYATGVRNVSRAGFDRATGDLYMGDVGENLVEEVSFLKAGKNASGPPVDFGWPQREGSRIGRTSPFASTNPFTGVASLNPIQEFVHTTGGNAVIGGYVYRGPIASLRGKYFYADFVPGQVLQLDFDRDTDPALFNGNNGTRTDVTALWSTLVMDPSDPTYDASIGQLFGIDHLVSFGEDNAGNLYLVDFGYGTGFSGQYPGAGLGEIFRLTAVPEPGIPLLVTAVGGALVGRRGRFRRGCAAYR